MVNMNQTVPSIESKLNLPTSGIDWTKLNIPAAGLDMTKMNFPTSRLDLTRFMKSIPATSGDMTKLNVPLSSIDWSKLNLPITSGIDFAKLNIPTSGIDWSKMNIPLSSLDIAKLNRAVPGLELTKLNRPVTASELLQKILSKHVPVENSMRTIRVETSSGTGKEPQTKVETFTRPLPSGVSNSWHAPMSLQSDHRVNYDAPWLPWLLVDHI